MGSSRGRGFTLIEVIVAGGLLLFLMGGMFLVVENGMRYFRLGYAFQTAQQQALVGLRKMVSELQNSRMDAGPAGILDGVAPPYSGTQPYLIFPSARPSLLGSNGSGPLVHETAAGPTVGLLQWQKWVCFYLDAAVNPPAVPYANLVRTEQAMGTPKSFPPGPGTWDAAGYPSPSFITMSGITSPKQILAKKVSLLSFAAGAVNREIVITIVVSEETASDKQTQVRLQERVTLGNTP